jgi:fibroblast growth factor receptor 1
VADFGLSRSIRDKDSDTYEQKTGGEMPIRWMSPESLSMGVFSSKSDVWAFGILLWEIVTLGSTPYIGMSAQQVIKSVRDGYICDQPEHCNEEYYALMKSCWAYNSIDRLSFTEIRIKLSKLIEFQRGYVDLDHFPENVYYNLYSSPGEKV